MTTRLAKYCEGIMEAAWLAAVVLVPVFFNTYSARIFEPDKITLLRSLALLILAAWVVKLVDEGQIRWNRMSGYGSLWNIIKTFPLLIPVLCLILVYLLSTIFSVAPRTSLWGSYQRLQGTYTMLSYLVIFAALLGNLRRRQQIDRLITCIILASLPVSLYGILQRLRVDPVPWAADVTVRVAANLGNSIFVAAYLIMAFPLTVGRIVESFDAILKDEHRLVVHIARGTVYVFTALVQVITIYLSGSRGPFLGLLASLFFLLLLLSLRWRKRWLTYLVILGAIAGSIFLLLLNVQNGPLESVRRSPAVGRLGRILDPNSNNALVRKYIWQGAAKLVAPHAPLVYPDGRKDPFNILRPLIGYGPESLYVAFNPFYPPQLGQVEKRNASPDRSHNETWDTLVFTGIFGFLVYLMIFMAVFYYGLKWLGMIQNRNQQYLFYALSFGCGLIGAVLMILWGGVEFFGVGLPFGIAVGLIIYLALIAASGSYETPKNPGESARSLVLIVLFAAVLAHFLEINFGIAIAATRTYFWVSCALLVLVGYLLPIYGQYGTFEQEAIGNDADRKVSGEIKGSRSKRRKESAVRPQTRSWQTLEIVEGSLLIGLILITLNYIYILNQSGLTSGLAIFWTSLARLPEKGNAIFFGVILLYLVCWVFGSIVYTSEIKKSESLRSWFNSFLLTMGVSGGIGLLMGLLHSSSLARIAASVPKNQEDLINNISAYGGLLTNFYIWVFVILFFMAFMLVRSQIRQITQRTRWGWISVPVMFLLFIGATYSSNLRIVHADIAFKMADPFASSDQWLVASLLYNHAIDLAPNEDYYYLFLGRSYLEEAKLLTDPEAQESLVRRAEEDLKTAQAINPLNTDHTANLARLYSWWATRASDAEQREERGLIASDYYRRAVTLSPNNSTLWGEWATLLLDVLEEPEEARLKLEYALNLDPGYVFTQGLMGDYYVKVSRTKADVIARKQDLLTALEYYRTAVKVAKPAEKTLKINYMVMMGNVFVELAGLNSNELDPVYLRQAADAYQKAVDEKPDKRDLVRIEEQIARIYIELGERDAALLHAQNALQAADPEQQENLHQLIQQIEVLP